MKVAFVLKSLLTGFALTSMISCSTLQNLVGSDQPQADASGLATSPRGDGADVVDPNAIDSQSSSSQTAASGHQDMDSLSLDESHGSSDLQTEVQMDQPKQQPAQASMEPMKVAEPSIAPMPSQAEMSTSSSQSSSHVDLPANALEAPAVEVYDTQSVTQEQHRAFKAPKKHIVKVEKKSSKKLSKAAQLAKDKKDKKAKKLAMQKKDKKSKIAKKSSKKTEKLAKGSKGKKGSVAKSSKSKKEKVVKSKTTKSKSVSSKTTKKGKKDRKVASSKEVH